MSTRDKQTSILPLGGTQEYDFLRFSKWDTKKKKVGKGYI